MDGWRLLRTSFSVAFDHENFLTLPYPAINAHGIATPKTDFRANGAGICANLVENVLLS